MATPLYIQKGIAYMLLALTAFNIETLDCHVIFMCLYIKNLLKPAPAVTYMQIIHICFSSFCIFHGLES